jgi:hypothetical protein
VSRFRLLTVLGAAVALATPAGALGVQVAENAPQVQQVQEDERSLPVPGDTLAARLQAPLVYVDCDRCDGTHIRREITFVNHVRDPGPAEVHVLVTDQPTGAGGRRYTLAFLGRGRFSGLDNTLTYHSLQSDTEAQERDGVTGILKLGLVPYAARTPMAEHLSVLFDEPAAGPAFPVEDSWNHWTFEIYLGGNFNQEATQSAWNARYGVYADRVTEEWKIRLRPFFNNNVRSIVREGEEDVRLNQRRHGFDSWVIRSLGAHWGAGMFADYITHTQDNLRHQATVTPAVEYSYFPYAEATRRQITVAYRMGVEGSDYFEETIFEETNETLFNHSLDASVQIHQPWGSISSRLRGVQYLHDLELYRITFDGAVSFRLGHGFSVNVGGSYQRINDQLSLPRGDASLEDILLERRRLATSYRSSGSIALSYTFGSIFTNVVNPRF